MSKVQEDVVRHDRAHAAAESEHGRLMEERYKRMASALKVLESKLSSVYQCLTGGVGDAHLSYTLERQLLFTNGITLHARPDVTSRWRPVGMLSGGQQALATLALSCAMQVGQ